MHVELKRKIEKKKKDKHINDLGPPSSEVSRNSAINFSGC